MPLPPSQQRVWDYFKGYQATHGYAPTVAEIRKALGVNSHVQVVRPLNELRRKGYVVDLRREGKNGHAALAPDDDPTDDLATFQLAWKDQDMLLDMVQDGLMAGLQARDAVKRARDAQGWIRSQIKALRPNEADQRTIRLFCRAAMRARGVDSGSTLAQRAIEAVRLLKEPA